MAIPLTDLHEIVTKIQDLRDYVRRRPYYNRDRAADEIAKLADMINLAASEHTYYNGWRDEQDRQRKRYRPG